VPRVLNALTIAPRAWAGNTINTSIYRHHGVLTVDRTQWTAFYLDARRLRVVQRDLESGELHSHDLPGRYPLHDAHGSISLGCDRRGRLHLAFGCHSSPARYRRALHPFRIDAWTDERALGSGSESRMTYPAFLMPPEAPLLLLYRDGWAGRGAARQMRYDEAADNWRIDPLPWLDGSHCRPWTSSPYWNRPVLDRAGCLHLAFVWRSAPLGERRRLHNVGVCYARSRDHGASWESTRGWPLSAPITPVTAETVFAVPAGANLINQSGMATDAEGRPHIVFYADDADGVPQYRHLWWDGREWRHQVLTQRSQAFALEGDQTLQLPISRPEILFDDENCAYLVFRGDLSNDRLAVMRLLPPDYAPSGGVIRLLDLDLGFAEPVVDMARWDRERVLSVFVQRNLQPPHDREIEPAWEPARLVDFDLVGGAW
jgi:hypothetical protein